MKKAKDIEKEVRDKLDEEGIPVTTEVRVGEQSFVTPAKDGDTAEPPEPDKFTVKFSADNLIIEETVYEEGAAVQLPKNSAPEKDDHIFMFWSSDGTTNYFMDGGDTTIDGDLYLTAVYQLSPYVKVYYSAGGTVIHMIELLRGSNIQPPDLFAPDLQGQKFIYWTLDGDENFFGADTTVDSTITLTAKYENLPNGLVIVRCYYYDKEGRLYELAPLYYNKGTMLGDVNLPNVPPDFIPDGMTFRFWSIDGETNVFGHKTDTNLALIAVFE